MITKYAPIATLTHHFEMREGATMTVYPYTLDVGVHLGAGRPYGYIEHGTQAYAHFVAHLFEGWGRPGATTEEEA